MRNSRQLRAYNIVFYYLYIYFLSLLLLSLLLFLSWLFFNVQGKGKERSFGAAHFGYRVKLSHLTFPSCWGNDQQSSSPESFPRQGKTVRGEKETEKIHSNYTRAPSTLFFSCLFSTFVYFHFVLFHSHLFPYTAIRRDFFILFNSKLSARLLPQSDNSFYDLYLTEYIYI